MITEKEEVMILAGNGIIDIVMTRKNRATGSIEYIPLKFSKVIFTSWKTLFIDDNELNVTRYKVENKDDVHVLIADRNKYNQQNNISNIEHSAIIKAQDEEAKREMAEMELINKTNMLNNIGHKDLFEKELNSRLDLNQNLQKKTQKFFNYGGGV